MSNEKGSRRLSIAFDNFRHKCRKTRIDSLLSPPLVLDLSHTCSSGSISSAEWEGISLDSKPSSSSGHASHVEFAFPSETDVLAESEVDNELSENQRVIAALENLQTNSGADSYDVDPEVGCFFRCKRVSAPEVIYGIDPFQDEQVAELFGVSPSEISPMSDEEEGEELGFGIPLERQGSRPYQAQMQKRPQAAEQILCQARGAVGKRTVDGVRLDGRPLTRHSGTAAPHQTQMAGSPSAERKYRVSAEEHLGVLQGCWGQHQTSQINKSRCSPTTTSRNRVSSQAKPPEHEYIPRPERGVYEHSIPEVSNSIYRVDSVAQSCEVPHPVVSQVQKTTYPRTSPPVFTFRAPPAIDVTLSSVHNVASFHHDLCGRLRRSIDDGKVRTSQIPVKERMRRLSGGLGGMGRGVRRMGKGVGDAAAWAGEGIMASGSIGVGWGRMSDGVDERRGNGAAVAAIGHGGGFF